MREVIIILHVIIIESLSQSDLSQDSGGNTNFLRVARQERSRYARAVCEWFFLEEGPPGGGGGGGKGTR